MAPNTKKWGDRIQEVYQQFWAMDDFEPSDFIQRELALKLDAMTEQQRKALSNSLHLEKQQTESWRKLVRAIMMVEQVLVPAMNRNPLTLVLSNAIPMSDAQLKTKLKQMMRAVDPWPDYGSPDLAVCRPVKIGTSISGGSATGPGSIACFVRDRATGRAMLLSNMHVVCQEFGDKTDLTNNAPVILQPAKMNGGAPTNRIGVAARGILDKRMDAAVCFLDPAIAFDNSTRAGGTAASVQITGANSHFQADDPVWKCGAMSYISRGRIKNPNKPSSKVPHGKFGGDVNFENQIEVETLIPNREFQIPGDSGSGLMNAGNEIIGLMHGGLKGGGLATPIQDVFDALQVDFW